MLFFLDVQLREPPDERQASVGPLLPGAAEGGRVGIVRLAMQRGSPAGRLSRERAHVVAPGASGLTEFPRPMKGTPRFWLAIQRG